MLELNKDNANTINTLGLPPNPMLLAFQAGKPAQEKEAPERFFPAYHRVPYLIHYLVPPQPRADSHPSPLKVVKRIQAFFNQ